MKEPINVLVIDDDERVRTLLGDILRFAGHQVIEASDGKSGMRCLETGGFDVVLTDLGMPEMNGWEVAKIVKRATPQIPVVLITGWGTNLDEQKVKESGVDGIIGKPFQVREVIEVVQQFFPQA